MPRVFCHGYPFNFCFNLYTFYPFIVLILIFIVTFFENETIWFDYSDSTSYCLSPLMGEVCVLDSMS